MQAPKFLIGKHPARGLLWAAINGKVNYLEPRITETRFAAYLAPCVTEEAAHEALLQAGANPDSITAEMRRKRNRRG